MVTGKRLQSYIGGKGEKTQFKFSKEMQYGNTGTTSMQLYTDTVTTLAKAKGLKFEVGRKKGTAIVSGVSSEEEGRVWKISSCKIPATKKGMDMYPATGKEIQGKCSKAGRERCWVMRKTDQAVLVNSGDLNGDAPAHEKVSCE